MQKALQLPLFLFFFSFSSVFVDRLVTDVCDQYLIFSLQTLKSIIVLVH